MMINGIDYVIGQSADLRGANLQNAYLRGANLRDANLWGAYLQSADLRVADLQNADLRGANLWGANLQYADLRDANLQNADLRDADLRVANLQNADLRGANLRGANLQNADLPALSIVPESGAFEAWKKLRHGILARVLIPADSPRSNATGRKCRAAFVDVLEIVGASDYGISSYDHKICYEVGKRVTCDEWCADRWQECAGGIHFFITRAEAEAY